MDEKRDMEDVSAVELGDEQLLLKEEYGNRVVDDVGYTLFECLAVIINSLLFEIQTQKKTKITDTAKIKKFRKPQFIQKCVLHLLTKHDKQFKSALIFLVDDISENKHGIKNIEDHIDTFYQSVIDDCKRDCKNQSYMKLYIYAAATCINTPIYIISKDKSGRMQVTFFKPLFNYDGQSAAVFDHVAMFVSFENTFHVIMSNDMSTRPAARGLIGMYLSILEGSSLKPLKMDKLIFNIEATPVLSIN